ncbi:MAG: SIS domain-containing protein, partial [Candidatus Limiplasma sp.]|nr:SIS domain-containing protein [Candidatus Limiplasma sp.]
QAEMLLMLAVSLARLRKSSPEAELDRLWKQLRLLPQKAQAALETERDVQRAASRLRSKKHAFFVGRGMDYALSMEGALKLKEVSYVFSEAYAAGELKHGPIALLQDGRLVVASVTQSALLEKTMSNLREAKTRGAYLVAVCTQSLLGRVSALADETIVIPDTDDLLAPLLAAIPLQLFAYCMAVGRGCDVDQPRNLAKSVTVE